MNYLTGFMLILHSNMFDRYVKAIIMYDFSGSFLFFLDPPSLVMFSLVTFKFLHLTVFQAQNGPVEKANTQKMVPHPKGNVTIPH